MNNNPGTAPHNEQQSGTAAMIPSLRILFEEESATLPYATNLP
jgi:hypothetical protein